MVRNVTAPKSKPEDVVRQTLAALEAGKEEILADEVSRQLKRGLSASRRLSRRVPPAELSAHGPKGGMSLLGFSGKVGRALLEERLDAFLRVGAGREVADALQVERHGVERILRAPACSTSAGG